MKWRATVDRIEGDLAMLLPIGRPEARFPLRLELLPPGIKDGVVVAVEIQIDPQSRAKARREISALQEDLARQ